MKTNLRECSLQSKGQYKAKLKLLPTDNFIEETNDRPHPLLLLECDVMKVKINIKTRAQILFKIYLSAELDHVLQAATVNLSSTST